MIFIHIYIYYIYKSTRHFAHCNLRLSISDCSKNPDVVHIPLVNSYYAFIYIVWLNTIIHQVLSINNFHPSRSFWSTHLTCRRLSSSVAAASSKVEVCDLQPNMETLRPWKWAKWTQKEPRKRSYWKTSIFFRGCVLNFGARSENFVSVRELLV